MAEQQTANTNLCTVLGFGGRTPAAVVDWLVAFAAANRSDRTTTTIIALVRSPGLQLALLKRGVFATVASAVAASSKKDNSNTTLLYCLASSWTEAIGHPQDAAFVRAAVLDTTLNHHRQTTNVHCYDVATATLYSTPRTCLQKLAQRDVDVAEHLSTTESTTNGSRATTTTTGDVVIVVGGGGREHALVTQLAASPAVGTVVCVPGNGGTQGMMASTFNGTANIINVGGRQDNETVIRHVQNYHADMVVVGPEGPLVDGLVDALAVACPDVMCFGPTQAAAQLEASKAFSKDFFAEHNIPTAQYRTFTKVDDAVEYVQSLTLDTTPQNRQVVKASGLAAGKGVLLPVGEAATIEAVRSIMMNISDDTSGGGLFGSAGDTCVLESFLDGPEASCLALCDGTTAVLLPAAQDHKRALDNDEGLNTGGMGAYAPAPCVTPTLQAQILQMCQTTVTAMAARGTPYVGVLYAGVLLTEQGPYLLEFNCRFGDPETQVVLPLLETDVYELFQACCRGTLAEVDVRFREGQSAATVVCAAQGYPQSYPKGMRIVGLPEEKTSPSGSSIRNNKTIVYHAGTKVDEAGVVRCTGGRVLAVTGVADTLEGALSTAYQQVHQVRFVPDDDTEASLLHYRTDIGRRAVGRPLRLGIMGSTRGTALLPVMEACANGTLNAEIVAVLSNRPDAPILDKGRSLGPSVAVHHLSATGLTREQYDAKCTAALVEAGVDFVCLVGYMRILSKGFTDYWCGGRCINVHPSLLPKHAGGMDLAVHQAVLDAQEAESGCTVHEVTEAVDGGPIVVQTRVAVDAGETAVSLKEKVQQLEGPAFVQAIQLYGQKQGSISYADAGVNIDAGNKLVDLIKPLCKGTRVPGCDADLGGFGGLFDLAAAGFDAAETVLIGATDGVGTKLRIAQKTGKHETVGIDLVAMCVNDLVVAGGQPLFFLDYFATGHLEIAEAVAVVKGIAEGCKQSNCGLIGGETAEMPSMYAPGDYDLAGFTVGAVHRDRILPQNVCKGDVLLGISSSGIHSNGFSLVRKLIEKEGLTYDSRCPWDESKPTIGDALLIPTKIYVKSCVPLIQKGLLKGLAHITGGGLLENLPRSLPVGVSAEISNHPDLPPVFKWMQQASSLGDDDMLKTFNCGIGMVLILSEDNVPAVLEMLNANGEDDVWELGVLVEGAQKVTMKTTLN